jgi:hypothetical protein
MYTGQAPHTVYLGNLLRTVTSEPPSYQITADAAKTPAAIARDIARRLLPTYRADRDRALEIHERNQEQRAWEQATAAEFAEIVSGQVFEDHRDRDTFYGGSGIVGHIKASVSYGYGVTFEQLSSIPVDTARQILELLRDAPRQP